MARSPEQRRHTKATWQARHRYASAKNLMKGLFFTLKPRRAKKLGSTLTLADLLRTYEAQRGLCFYTGIPMTWKGGSGKVATNISVDRVDPAKPYTRDNVVLCCYFINVSKHDKTIEEWLQWAEAVWRHCSRRPPIRLVS